MFDTGAFGKIMMFAGLILVVFGALFMLGGRIPWLGKLPGDISIHKEGFSFYFPITTSIIISIILSIVMMLMSRR